MFDERTNKRSPKQYALETWPNATCEKVAERHYIVLSNEQDQPRFIGKGRSAWVAWMEAEIALRTEEQPDGLICTSCHKESGQFPDTSRLDVEAIATLCQVWKCKACLDKSEQASES